MSLIIWYSLCPSSEVWLCHVCQSKAARLLHKVDAFGPSAHRILCMNWLVWQNLSNPSLTPFWSSVFSMGLSCFNTAMRKFTLSLRLSSRHGLNDWSCKTINHFWIIIGLPLLLRLSCCLRIAYILQQGCCLLLTLHQRVCPRIYRN